MLALCVEGGLATWMKKGKETERRWKEKEGRWNYTFSPKCFRNIWKIGRLGGRQVGGKLRRTNGRQMDKEMEAAGSFWATGESIPTPNRSFLSSCPQG